MTQILIDNYKPNKNHNKHDGECDPTAVKDKHSPNGFRVECRTSKNLRDNKGQRERYGPHVLADNKKRRNKTIQEFHDAYGNQCACCDSVDRLQMDHVIPLNKGRGRTSQEQGMGMALKAKRENYPDTYQLLCADCNNWKGNGPCCPCEFWDSVSPLWRNQDEF